MAAMPGASGWGSSGCTTCLSLQAETNLVHSQLAQQAGLALLPSSLPQVGRSRMAAVHLAISLLP